MMINACPARDRLRDYVRGSLPAGEVNSLDDHLNGCPECQAAVDTLDELAVPDLAQLTPAVPRAAAPDPLLERLLARAKGLAVPGTAPESPRGGGIPAPAAGQ